jgi:NADH-quinone oxidoreductase subunit C
MEPAANMSPEQVAADLVAAIGGGEPSVSGGGRWGRGSVTVGPHRWRAAVTAARDSLGCDFFDWLTAVDELEHGYAVVVHLWSTAGRHGVLIRTKLARLVPALESIVDIYPGANWPERETYEMFGVEFAGHPNLVPLLLPPEFEGHPLRKDFVLASRVVKPWPGVVEPGALEGGPGADGTPRRQPPRPPGVPAPGEWGSG